ncbi:MAG: hypothetical protein GTN40_04860 [Candidatus Aenigmarchaeota archaeon]|nr:hypothetical protein [Candidatus Aenigmarchaeota archaeon]
MSVIGGKIPHKDGDYESYGFPKDVISNITYLSIDNGKEVEIQIKGTQEYVNKILTESKKRFEKCFAVEIDKRRVKLKHD